MGCFQMYCALCGGPLGGYVHTIESKNTEWMKKLVYLEKLTNDDESWEYDGYGKIKNDNTEEIINIYDCKYPETSHLPVSLKAVHKSCWIVCDKPTNVLQCINDLMKKYQSQVFSASDFKQDYPDGDWMFMDPLINKKNKNRIKKCIK
jgi:hypothetical protein